MSSPGPFTPNRRTAISRAAICAPPRNAPSSAVDRNKLQIFGKTPDKETLSRHDGVEEYPTITTISESPVTADVLWAGTDDGNLQVTRDGGKTWNNVASKAPGVPKGTYVSRVVASKYAPGA